MAYTIASGSHTSNRYVREMVLLVPLKVILLCPRGGGIFCALSNSARSVFFTCPPTLVLNSLYELALILAAAYH